MKTGKRSKTTSQDNSGHFTEPVRKSSREKKRKVSNIYEYEISKKGSRVSLQTSSSGSSSDVSNDTKPERLRYTKGKKTQNIYGDDFKDEDVQLFSDKPKRYSVQDTSSKSPKAKSVGSSSNKSHPRKVEVSGDETSATRTFAKGRKTRKSLSEQDVDDSVEYEEQGSIEPVQNGKNPNTKNAGREEISRCSRDVLQDSENMSCSEKQENDVSSSAKVAKVSKQLLVKKLQLSPVELDGECNQGNSGRSKSDDKHKASQSPRKQGAKTAKSFYVRKSARRKKHRCDDDDDDDGQDDNDGDLEVDEVESSDDEYEPEKKKTRKMTSILSPSCQKKTIITRKKSILKDNQKSRNSKKVVTTKNLKSGECYCSYCGKMFKNRKLVTVHERIHSGEKPFPCSICGQRFVLKANMKHHEQLHSEDRPFMCEICGKCFKTKSYCTAHRKIHQTAKNLKCDVPGCNKAFSNRRNYQVHLLFHRGEKPYTCKDCGKAFRRKSDLNVHSSIHSETKRYQCKVCEKRFSQNYAYNAHLLLHKRKPFNCARCRRFFSTETERDSHQELHTRNPFYDCKICDRDNIELRMLSKHLKTVHNLDSLNLRCSTCLRSFPTQNIFDQHTGTSKQMQFVCMFCNEVSNSACELYVHRQTHKFKKNNRIMNNDENLHVCDICGKEFRRISSLQNHKQLHEPGNYKCTICGKESKNRSRYRAHIKTHSGIKPFCCETCGKTFVSRTNHQQHLLIHTGEKPHTCHICQKAFRTRALLNEHGNVHRRENPYKCELCGKEYASRTNFRNHVNVHKGQRNYECEVCGKRFFAKYVMRKHVMIHTGQKNYQCEYCGKEFIQHGNWLIHRRSHTGEKPHGCSQCPAGFVSSSQLKSHVKRVHDQKKAFMCDKCYKHFYDRKGLQAHIHNIHVRKEHGRIYHCSKCDKVFAVQENQCNHELNCTDFGKHFPSLRPSVLQSVLRKVHAQPQIQDAQEDHSLRSCKTQKIFMIKNIEDKNINTFTDKCTSLIQEPVQVLAEDSQSNPVPCPVQQFQIISLPQEDSVSVRNDSKTFPLKTFTSSSVTDEIESVEALETVVETETPNSNTEVKVEIGADQDFSDSLESHVSKTSNAQSVQNDIKGTSIKSSILNIQCGLCKEIFTTVQEASLHKKLHQKQESSCSDVLGPDIQYSDADGMHSDLGVTERSDLSSDSKFQCRLCKMFICDGEATQHKKIHQNQLLYQCSVCTARFPTAFSLTNHLQTHLKPPEQRNSLFSHRTSQNNSNIVSVASPKPYSCDICLKEFTLLGLLKMHKESHKFEIPLKCNVCGQILKGRRKFLLHQKTHSSGKRFKCDDCGRTFTMEAVFTIHQRGHKHPNPFKCSKCFLEFRYASNLRRHLRTHTAALPVISSLKEHEAVPISQKELAAVDSIPRQFTCDVCSISFSTAEDLSAHYPSHVFPNVNYLCQICNLHFDEESIFTEHIKLHGEVVFEVRPEEDLEVQEVQDVARIVTVLNSLSN